MPPAITHQMATPRAIRAGMAAGSELDLGRRGRVCRKQRNRLSLPRGDRGETERGGERDGDDEIAHADAPLTANVCSFTTEVAIRRSGITLGFASEFGVAGRPGRTRTCDNAVMSGAF